MSKSDVITAAYVKSNLVKIANLLLNKHDMIFLDDKEMSKIMKLKNPDFLKYIKEHLDLIPLYRTNGKDKIRIKLSIEKIIVKVLSTMGINFTFKKGIESAITAIVYK